MICIRTNEGVVIAERKNTTIVLDFYGKGYHEILEVAQAIGLDPDYQTLNVELYESCLLLEG